MALTYALLQPDLAALRSEQMRLQTDAEAMKTPRQTPVFDAIDKVLRTMGWKPFDEDELAQAGIKAGVNAVVAWTLLMAIGAFVVGQVLLQSIPLALLLAVVSPFVMKIYVSFMTNRRREKFENQMAETMTLFSSALKSGMNVPTALANVAQEMEAPMGEELARIVNETRLGRDLIEGMLETAQRMDSKDFGWVSEAVAIQRESGGRLSEILDRVTETIAERNELRQKIQALAAEGKMSGYVLMALPIAVGAGYSVMNPAYMEPLYTTVTGKLILAASAVLYVLGYFWMSKVTKVKL
ncbi:type II secretion system F family protein [Aeromicrobium sp.]|uniref:type II secretion system F family protein n=1 Tax=Aeromicrobium sp. TaxID=1871063 RepID=UPI0028AE528B|nr:type II secretion system F family protein [Aeromicrobium sp.]